MMTVAVGCSSTTVTPDSSESMIEFDAETFTLSFQGSEEPVNDVVAVLKAEHGIAVTPHGEPGVDRQSISDSFKNLDLIAALDRLFGANRYHFEISGDDRMRPVPGYAKNQPDEVFAKRPGLDSMPREPGKMRPADSDNAMAAPEIIKASEELKAVEGGMPLAREIEPGRADGIQRATDDVPLAGKHLRIRLICAEDGFAVENVKLAEGMLNARRTVVGDFFVVLMEEDKVVYMLSRQNPLVEHPFHHERDARGNLAGGPIRIDRGDPCSPFTIRLPASDRLEKQSIQFFEYVSKPGSSAPSQLDEETYLKSVEGLEPRGSLAGAAVLRAMRDDYKQNGEAR
jgi:hypothetical protein